MKRITIAAGQTQRVPIFSLSLSPPFSLSLSLSRVSFRVSRLVLPFSIVTLDIVSPLIYVPFGQFQSLLVFLQIGVVASYPCISSFVCSSLSPLLPTCPACYCSERRASDDVCYLLISATPFLHIFSLYYTFSTYQGRMGNCQAADHVLKCLLEK